MSRPVPPSPAVWPPPHRLYLLCAGTLWALMVVVAITGYVWLRWRAAVGMPPLQFLSHLGADGLIAILLGVWLHRSAERWARVGDAPLVVLRRLYLRSVLFLLVVVAAVAAALWLGSGDARALASRALFSRLPAVALDYVFFWAVALTAAPLPFLRAHAADTADRPAQPRRLAVRSIGRVQYVACEDILALSAAENYVELLLADRTLLHRATMREMETLLAPDAFVRVHRSAMVRLSAVAACERGPGERMALRLHNGRLLPVSRSYRAAISAALASAALADTSGTARATGPA
jgi:LytTr DNA-binding domain